MPVKALLWGRDDLYEELLPRYLQAQENGVIEIVGCAAREGGTYVIRRPDGSAVQDVYSEAAIVSSKYGFFERRRELEAMGVARRAVIDGRIFRAGGRFDLPRLCREGVAHIEVPGLSFRWRLHEPCYTVHPRVYRKEGSVEVRFGTKSYAQDMTVESSGLVQVGSYTAMGWDILCELGVSGHHDYTRVASYADFDRAPGHFGMPPGKETGILVIGSDVWVARGVRFKANSSQQPTVIGDGAVIAADSVVVGSVPPYAIVGGNPARLIKYRFPEDIREKLLRIRWWDWEPEKIYENFDLMRDVQQFTQRFAP